MNADTGSIPTTPPDNNGGPPDPPDSEKSSESSDSSPPQPVAEALPPELEGSDLPKVGQIVFDEYVFPERPQLHLMAFRRPPRPGDPEPQKTKKLGETVRGVVHEVVRGGIALTCIATPVVMLFLHYSGEEVGTAAAFLAGPLGIVVHSYFGKKSQSKNSKKRKKR